MKCQFCGSKLDKSGVCPVCGKTSKSPEKPSEEKKLNKTRLFISIAAAAVLIAVIVCILGFSLGWFDSNTEVGDTQLSSDEDFGTTAVTAKASYAVTTALPGDADMTRDAARFEGGSITNGEFNIYFWMEYYSFLNSYGSFASYLGLDTEMPLDQQDSLAPADENDENSAALTWEQYFLQAAAENCAYYKGLELAANADGFVLPEEYQSELDGLSESLAEDAAAAGYPGTDAFLQENFGTGVCEADYLSYMTTYLTAYAYYTEVLQVRCAPTDAEVEAYFDENAASYLESYGLEKTDLADIAVRHILIQPEFTIDSDGDGTNDEATDEAWAQTEATATAIYEEWKEDPTEDHFAELAVENSADGNAASGGLYDDVYPGQMVATFNDWCFDPARQPGDTGIVKTQFGYHIMYFTAHNDNYYWFDTAKADLTSEQLQDLSDTTAAQYPVRFNYNNIVLCDVVSYNISASTAEK